jgi:tRNA threonylcarbamoyladenosine biosynthesis protein TsaB
MKLLALDTATEACSAALWVDGEIDERFEVIGRGHAERILPMADELLTGAGLAVGDLDTIAFGRGPGGFTGLRIAAGVAQGLASGIGRDVVPVSDLAAVALHAARSSGERRVIACMDARMGQVYWAAYDCGGAAPGPVASESLSVPDSVDPPAGEPWFGAGHGFSAHPGLAIRLGSRLRGVDATVLPHASDIARIAAVEALAGRAAAPARALPVYIRDDVVHRR